MNDAKDYSNIYAPLWKRQAIITLVALALGSIGIIFAVLGNKTMFCILFVCALVTTIIISFILRCPACGCYICWNTKVYGYRNCAMAPIPFDKKCPHCEAVLRK